MSEEESYKREEDNGGFVRFSQKEDDWLTYKSLRLPLYIPFSKEGFLELIYKTIGNVDLYCEYCQGYQCCPHNMGRIKESVLDYLEKVSDRLNKNLKLARKLRKTGIYNVEELDDMIAEDTYTCSRLFILFSAALLSVRTEPEEESE